MNFECVECKLELNHKLTVWNPYLAHGWLAHCRALMMKIIHHWALSLMAAVHIGTSLKLKDCSGPKLQKILYMEKKPSALWCLDKNWYISGQLKKVSFVVLCACIHVVALSDTITLLECLFFFCLCHIDGKSAKNQWKCMYCSVHYQYKCTKLCFLQASQ